MFVITPLELQTFLYTVFFTPKEHRQIQRKLYYIVSILVIDGIEMVHTVKYWEKNGIVRSILYKFEKYLT